MVQYTAPFLRGSEGHLIQSDSAEAHFLEPRAVSYFPFRVQKPEPRAAKAEAVGFGLSHTPPAGSPQPNGIWLLMQSASLLHPEAGVWRGGIKRGLAAWVSLSASAPIRSVGLSKESCQVGDLWGKEQGRWESILGDRVHPIVSSPSFTLGDMGVFKRVTAAAAMQARELSLWSSHSRCYISRSYKEGGDSVQTSVLTSWR